MNEKTKYVFCHDSGVVNTVIKPNDMLFIVITA